MSPRRRQCRLTGELALRARGYVLHDRDGMAWQLDLDQVEGELVGSNVIVEGERTGLSRVVVAWIGRSCCCASRQRLQAS